MKYLTLTLLFLFTALSNITAQTTSGFVGTWLLDEDASFSREVDKKAFDKYEMVITEDDESFLIKISFTMDKRPVAYDLELFKDGRGEKNDVGGRFFVTSTTEVKERQIIRNYRRPGPHANGKPMTEGVEKFLLSKDGEKLIRAREQTPDDLGGPRLRDIPGIAEHLAAELPSRLVFRRKT